MTKRIISYYFLAAVLIVSFITSTIIYAINNVKVSTVNADTVCDYERTFYGNAVGDFTNLYDNYIWDDNYSAGSIVEKTDSRLLGNLYRFSHVIDDGGFCLFGGLNLVDASQGQNYTFRIKFDFSGLTLLYIEYVDPIGNDDGLFIVYPDGTSCVGNCSNLVAEYDAETLTAILRFRSVGSDANKGYIRFVGKNSSAVGETAYLFVESISVKNDLNLVKSYGSQGVGSFDIFANDNRFWDQNYSLGQIVQAPDTAFGVLENGSKVNVYKYSGTYDAGGYLWFGGIHLYGLTANTLYKVRIQLYWENADFLFFEHVEGEYGAVKLYSTGAVLPNGGNNISISFNPESHVIEATFKATTTDSEYLKFTAFSESKAANPALYMSNVVIRQTDILLAEEFENYSLGEFDCNNVQCNFWKDNSTTEIVNYDEAKALKFNISSESEYCVIGYINRLQSLIPGVNYLVTVDYEITGVGGFFIEYVVDGGAGLYISATGEVSYAWGSGNNLTSANVVTDANNPAKGRLTFVFTAISGKTEMKLTTRYPDAGDKSIIFSKVLIDGGKTFTKLNVNGRTFIGYDVDGVLYNPTATLSTFLAERSIPIAAYFMTKTGASIRTSVDSGIRFKTEISASDISMIEKYTGETLKMGTLITSESLSGYLPIEKTIWFDENEDTGINTYTGVLTGFNDTTYNYYNYQFKAIGYITIKYYGSSSRVNLAAALENESDCTRSIAGVAVAVMNDCKDEASEGYTVLFDGKYYRSNYTVAALTIVKNIASKFE